MSSTQTGATTSQKPILANSNKNWKPWKLQLWFTIPVLLIDVGIIAAIIALERVSAARNGLVSVPSISATSLTSFSIKSAWSYGLLWTTLPSFLMSLYLLAWDTTVSATADRQPFVELRRPSEEATNVRRTIMLDYRGYPKFYNWGVAFRHHHWLIGCAMLLSLICSIALVPLTAHLLVSASTQTSSILRVHPSSQFNDSAVTAQTDLQPAISIATALRVYGAPPLPWMTTEYGFGTFSNDTAGNGNMTVDVSAYSAYLDCQIMDSSQYSMNLSDGSVTIDINDRGCNVPTFPMPVASSTHLYLHTWNTQECTISARYSRFGLISGEYSKSAVDNLANLTVLSCIPEYWNTSGSLTVQTQRGVSPRFISFDARNASMIRPFSYKVFEDTLPDYQAFDPTNTIVGDAFGRLVYDYSTLQNNLAPLDQTSIKNSAEDVFTAIYASLAATTFLQPTAAVSASTASFSKAETRLFVVTPVAYTMVGILALVLICHSFLIWHAERSRSILSGEEPVGLLGAAALLDGGDVLKCAEDFRRKHPEVVEMRNS
ncbi:hypothetical protein NA57DRAFT_76094 [Rhizodiscina lignyota]|uniref:Uncharacterized protein n=1 Tax=Rhizodiscina lignyota TaxID=1504668 RepID=A0A9P4IGH0_9PEZI|nr:hypothetical protein NA57DRAFT_76094 [Rhizodiscina lignyota]